MSMRFDLHSVIAQIPLLEPNVIFLLIIRWTVPVDGTGWSVGESGAKLAPRHF